MIAYFDCFSGASGDMIAGAFLDAGVPFDWLRDELKKLPVQGFEISLEDVRRSGIGGKRFRVSADKDQPERRLSDIRDIISGSRISVRARDLSIKVFEALAEAEARVHRSTIEEVHFHEVGALDSIVDIVSAGLSIDYLRIKEGYASRMPLSGGFVECSHGRLPIPAPAVAELLKGVPVFHSDVIGETVTPTGAAILKTVCKGFGEMPGMTISRVGYGAGERENECIPNLLRIFLGEEDITSGKGKGFIDTDTVSVIESEIDDMSPEVYPYISERLFLDGALDVSLSPVHMKKGRPGTSMRVICVPGDEVKVARVVLSEASTNGVRISRVPRLKLPRELVEVETVYGKLKVKVARGDSGVKVHPEYEDCRKIAMEKGVPIREVYLAAERAYKG